MHLLFRIAIDLIMLFFSTYDEDLVLMLARMEIVLMLEDSTPSLSKFKHISLKVLKKLTVAALKVRFSMVGLF